MSSTLSDDKAAVHPAYLAGIIDGEGWIGIGFQPDPNRRAGKYHRLEVIVVNNNEGLLHRLQESYGGGVRPHDTRSEWRTMGATAERVLLTALPFLIVKREQARLALEFRATYERKGRYVKLGLSDELVAIREGYRRQISELNQLRGRDA